MKRRLSRAKAKIKATGIPFAVPDAHLLAERLDAVLAVVYLIYNEGYRGRVDLGAEAIRLGRVLVALMPHEPEAHGLLALMMIHHARRRARFSGEDLVLLDDQDRSLWDTDAIAAGRAVLDRAMALGGRRRPYVAAGRDRVAADARTHRLAAGRADVSSGWSTLTGSPVVELNHAVALAQAGDPDVGAARRRPPRPRRLPLLPLDPRRIAAPSRPRRRRLARPTAEPSTSPPRPPNGAS